MSDDELLPFEHGVRRVKQAAAVPRAPRLPTKGSNGHLVAPMRSKSKPARKAVSDDEEEDADEDEEEQAAEADNKEEDAVETPGLKAIKKEVAALGSKVLADPVTALKDNLLARLFELAELSPSLKARRLALLSLLAILKDIAPDYKVRAVTEKEEKGLVSKQVRITWKFEKKLLEDYARFVKVLLSLLAGAPWERRGSPLQPALCRAAATCVAQLAAAKPEFNLGDQLVLAVINRMSSPDEATSKTCCEAASSLMRSDDTFKMALDIVRVLGKTLESKGSLAPVAVRTLLDLKLSGDVNDVRALAREVKLKKQRRDKRRRVGPDVMQALDEVDVAQSSRHLTVARQTELLREVFTLYLRVVKGYTDGDARVGEPLVSEALRGIGRILGLLNPAFVRALLSVLVGFQHRAGVGAHVAFEVVSIGLAALALPGNEISFDAAVLPAMLLEHAQRATAKQVPAVVRCAQQMFLKARLMDIGLAAQCIERVLACATRVGAVNAVLALVALARQMLQRYPLLADAVLGGVSVKAAAEELPVGPPIPVANGAMSSSAVVAHVYAWRLLATRHWHPAVRAMAAAGLKGRPLAQGETPMELFRRYDAAEYEGVFVGASVPATWRVGDKRAAAATSKQGGRAAAAAKKKSRNDGV